MGHPPCPPRAYKKLYAFLDKSLSTSITGLKRSGSLSAPGTPSRSRSSPSTPVKDSRVTRTPSKATATPRGLQNTPSKSTPLKTAVTNTNPQSRSHTPQKPLNTRHNGLFTSTVIPDAPAWVMGSIRNVCKTLSTPAPRTNTWSRPPISRTLPPHMFAGVSSILYFISDATANTDEDLDEEMLEFLEPVTAAKDTENDEDFKEVVNALIVAVYFLVLSRRRNPESEADGESKKLDKKTFSEMRQTALVSVGLPPTERRHRDDVDQWIALVMEQNWASGKEWFDNIPQAGEVDGEDAYLSEEGGEEDHEGGRGKRQKTTMTGYGSLFSRNSSRKGLLPGLGTMMQDRVDYLSDDRREDYVEWKADIMAQVEEMSVK
ncbi:hypothetical protein FE257_011710 [Aspergillus nanangensis]|uniref:Origin recognition complex, subunit 6 n=1 Tax=Aspergillus nanangensis TaxID=2582783 RepID=A0AAD4CV52_ASPNN|nr:hypothetical protein FE257_011710 [Aspergillus nanangensis]